MNCALLQLIYFLYDLKANHFNIIIFKTKFSFAYLLPLINMSSAVGLLFLVGLVGGGFIAL
jgi:hypothetical protein